MVLSQLLVALAFAALCAAAVHRGCVDPGPPVDAPQPSTPRAGYCAAVAGATPWLQFVVAPLAALALALIALRKRPALAWVLVGVVTAALIANAAYMDSLPYSPTI